ncbi:MAG: hypothetical protein WD070_04305, partial [Pirellulaceae bacterium]
LDHSQSMQKLHPWITGASLLLLGLVGTPCGADTVSRVDLRSGSGEAVDYFVVICARESEPWGTGHTFVVWVQQEKRTGETHSQGFGFYPAVEKVVMRLFTGSGAIRDESTKSASIKPWLLTHRLIVHVDRGAFEASLRAKERWADSGVGYHLFRRNCTHFAHDIMQAIQLGAPQPTLGERPSSYVGRLMTLDLEQNRARFERQLERLPTTFVNRSR